MTSSFATHRLLSRQTHMSSISGARLSTVTTLDDKLTFYLNYLKDVVPYGVTVQHVPSDQPSGKREEIHLLTPSGKIFMSGLVGKDRNPTWVEEVAASEAYTLWLEGEFIPDGETWRFFTGLERLRFFNSDERDSWKMESCEAPMDKPDRVAEFLQQQYDSLTYR